MGTEVVAIAGGLIRLAEWVPRCDGITTFRRSLIGAGGQQDGAGSSQRTTHYGGTEVPAPSPVETPPFPFLTQYGLLRRLDFDMATRFPNRSETRFNGNDAARFDRLYREHVERIFRFAHRLCGEENDAKDLVQETFLNAYRGLKDFRGDASITTWLYTIAAHACVRMRRRRKGEPERELSLEEFVPTSEGEFQLQLPAKGLSPQQTMENKELRRALSTAIQKLPRKYRLVLVLRDMEGLSAKAVGSIMRLNERAVKSRLHRARLFVRKELSAHGMGTPSPKRRVRSLDSAHK